MEHEDIKNGLFYINEKTILPIFLLVSIIMAFFDLFDVATYMLMLPVYAIITANFIRRKK